MPFVLRRRDRHRTRAQSLVEFALVAPLLLLVFAAAADLGRAFYGYVALENAAKEGAFFGARKPLCDDAGTAGCADPGNVVWRVRSELREQGIRNVNGTEVTPVVACLAPGGAARANLQDCDEGDTYQVAVSYQFRFLTPIVGSMFGDMTLASTARSVVLNLAFDPTPGASVQKFVLPTTATNAIEITSKCLEPDDLDANGYYRSPCRDSSTPTPGDVIALRFEQGATINYRLRVANIGAQTLTGVTVVDSRGATGCSFPATMGVGFAQVCDYSRTAPNVTGSAPTMDFDNTVTMDSNQTLPSSDGATVVVERPPAKFQVLKWVSPFREGGDGDGVPGFGTVGDLTVTYSSQLPSPFVWFKVIVRNVGGQPATGITVTDTAGALPFGQNNATAVCPSLPSSLAAGGMWECRYRVAKSSSSPAASNNTVNATSPDVVPDSNDTATATARVTACTGPNRTVPNLIGLQKAAAQTAWTAAGFTGTLSVWSGQPNDAVVTQNRTAFDCLAESSTMTVTRIATP